jgi:uncharacterized protein (TIGR02231 family)
MNRHIVRFVLISFAIGFFVIPAQADEISADAKLTAITVYSDRAMITRRAEIDIPAGAHSILISGLSPQLYADSLRTQGKSQVAMTLGAISHKIVNQSELMGVREKTLQAELESRQTARAKLEAEKSALEQQKTFLESLKAQAITKTDEELTRFTFNTDQWIAAGKVIQTGLAEAAIGMIEKEKQIAQIDKDIEAIQNNINQLYTGNKSTLQVTIPVETISGGKLTLDLSYQLPGARWSPVYDARLDTKTGKLEIIQYGSVAQATGEDWSDVALNLSTARPQRGAGLPTPTPQWVNIYDTQNYNQARGISADMEMAIATSAPMAMESAVQPNKARFNGANQEQEITLQVATIETGGFNAEYKIAGLNDVPADGTETKLLIGPFETENKLEIQVQPHISTEAFLVARATLKGETPILPGPVSLFRDGDFIGQSAFPLLRAGKETELAFGIDDQITVKRDTLSDEKGQSGMLVGVENVIERATSTEIQNLRKSDIDLVVMETVPAPRDEKIRLEIAEDKTSKGYELDADKIKGLLRWKTPMKAGEKTAINLGWKLFWPKDSQISGLPGQNY